MHLAQWRLPDVFLLTVAGAAPECPAMEHVLAGATGFPFQPGANGAGHLKVAAV